MTVFPFSNYWWMYVAFTGLVSALLYIDLAFHRRERPQSIRVALGWTAVWVFLACAFCCCLYVFTSAVHSAGIARQVGMEFLAGYVVEESLSVDNMFVFAIIFRHFLVPAQLQHKVLFYGVLGAIVCRGLFIAVGSALVRFEWVFMVFGIFLIFSAFRLGFGTETVSPDESRLLCWVRRFVPVTRNLHGSRFFVRMGGRLHATPLIVVLLFLETTDVVFATDSVPAVFGVTREPFIVYSSNIFAVLGLRSLFFALSGAVERFHALKYGLSAVLAFIGLKMVLLDRIFGGRFPTSASLAVIGILLGISIVFSLAFPDGIRFGRGIWAVTHTGLSIVIGILFVALGILAIWTAADSAGRPAPFAPGVFLERKALCVSAVCYLLSGIVLLWKRPERKP